MKYHQPLKHLALATSVIGTLLLTNNIIVSANDNTETNSSTEQLTVPTISIDEYERNIQGVHSISYEDLMNKVSNKDTFILFVGYKECKYCRAFSPELKEFIQQDSANVYYLDWDTIRGQNISDPNFINFIKNDLQLSGTPTIALLQNGVVNQDLNLSGYGFALSDLEVMLHPNNSTTSSASSSSYNSNTASSVDSNSNNSSASSSASSNSNNSSASSSASSNSDSSSASSSASSNSDSNTLNRYSNHYYQWSLDNANPNYSSNLKSNINLNTNNGFVSYTDNSQSSANSQTTSNSSTTQLNSSSASDSSIAHSNATNANNNLNTQKKKRQKKKLKKRIHQLNVKEHKYRHKLSSLKKKQHYKREVNNLLKKIKMVKYQIKMLSKQL